jgi:DNA-binding FadR family transcriptional regulator
MRRNSVDRQVGLSDEQKQLRERIGADGWAKERRDRATYKQEYDTLMGSLPAGDRDAAARAMAVLVMPVDPKCPKGFEIDPEK